MNLEIKVKQAVGASDYASCLSPSEIGVVVDHVGQALGIHESDLYKIAFNLDKLAVNNNDPVAQVIEAQNGSLVDNYKRYLNDLKDDGLSSHEATTEGKKQLRALIASRNLRFYLTRQWSTDSTIIPDYDIDRISAMTNLCFDIFEYINPVVYPINPEMITFQPTGVDYPRN